MCSHAYRLSSIPMCVPHQPVVTLHAVYVHVCFMSLGRGVLKCPCTPLAVGAIHLFLVGTCLEGRPYLSRDFVKLFAHHTLGLPLYQNSRTALCMLCIL